MSTISLGSHIAARLVEIGVTEYFCVPGDFNMTLLDQLNACKELKMVNCCNELEAGYAADGYARAKGVYAWSSCFPWYVTLCAAICFCRSGLLCCDLHCGRPQCDQCCCWSLCRGPACHLHYRGEHKVLTCAVLQHAAD